MLFSEHLVIVRGGGDLATGVVYRLHKAGFPVVVLELAQPLVVRRRVALATAVLDGAIQIEDLHARLVPTWQAALALAHTPTIPVLVSPTLPNPQSFDKLRTDSAIRNPHSAFRNPQSSPSAAPFRNPQSEFRILIDARMAKRNIDTRIDQAPLVVGLGPGFTAGVDCHAVVETMRGHSLGRVIWQGAALPNTGTPGIVAGKGAERVLRAPAAGVVAWRLEIGDLVKAGELIGSVNDAPVRAPFDGVVRGLIAPGTAVHTGLKIGDVDARAERGACFTISDKSLAIGGAVLEAALTFLNGRQPTPDG
jgi:xanthine dehydrogenase accessory factor